MSEQQQLSMFDANQNWFRMMQDMIFSGEAAKMGPHGFMVYSIIKAHASMNTGEAFPGVPLIAQEGGMSVAQVKRELAQLESFGYLTRTKQGRNNQYELRERIEIKNDAGEVQALAWMKYIPMGMAAALADLKHVTMTGDLGGAKIVHIEHLVVNINAGDGTQVNFNAEVGKIPEGPLGDSLRQLLANRAQS